MDLLTLLVIVALSFVAGLLVDHRFTRRRGPVVRRGQRVLPAYPPRWER